jgi:LmbE family N-acetylglucosaminyl deacetylase
MVNNNVALGIGAHPDDAEFLFAGTLALLKNKGWEIHIATMTPGDCGTKEYSREEISEIRIDEAVQAAALLDAHYHCLGCDDAFILYDKPTLRKSIEIVRKVRPCIVFTLCQEDYMLDHINTGLLAMSGCFCCGIPNIAIEGVSDFEPIPHLYYADPAEGKDKYGAVIEPGMIVDISEVIDLKREMLCCHKSQREWLLQHHGMDEYVQTMEKWSAFRGVQIGKKYGEGFRQHLGHAFPHDNILKEVLGDQVHLRG